MLGNYIVHIKNGSYQLYGVIFGHFVSPDLKATLNSDPVIEAAYYYRSLKDYALLGKESELAEALEKEN